MKTLLKKIFKESQRQKLKLTEMPFQVLQDREPLEIGQKQSIPKFVYQTFKSNLIGKTHYKEIQKFRSLNPSLNFKFFDEAARDEWMKKNYQDRKIFEIYHKLKYNQGKADIWRYCVLCKNGGYYFDISKGCSVPLQDLHEHDSEALISYESNALYYPPSKESFDLLSRPDKYVLCWGFGFVRNHPILRSVIESIECEYDLYKKREFFVPKEGLLMFTATGRFTKIVRSELSKDPAMNIVQAGIDFNGNGIFFMKGAEARYLLSPAYAEIRNSIIVD